MTILGIQLERLDLALVRTKLEQFLCSEKGHLVATVNPEMLVAARHDPSLRRALRGAAMRTTDGTGLVLVSGGRLRRCTGNDLVAELAAMAARQGKRVLLLGGEGERAARAAEVLRSRYPGLRADGLSGGRIEKREGGWRMDPDLLERIRAFEPDILLAGLGHGKQETFLDEHLDALPSVRVAVGVGGVIDFLSGDALRAPVWMRRVGLEWLWRLKEDPRRFRRILTATVAFPILHISDTLTRNERV